MFFFFNDSGSEFQRTVPEYVRLDLKRSVLGIVIEIVFMPRDRLTWNICVRS